MSIVRRKSSFANMEWARRFSTRKYCSGWTSDPGMLHRAVSLTERSTPVLKQLRLIHRITSILCTGPREQAFVLRNLGEIKQKAIGLFLLGSDNINITFILKVYSVIPF
jgi:hypothetical protein